MISTRLLTLIIAITISSLIIGSIANTQDQPQQLTFSLPSFTPARPGFKVQTVETDGINCKSISTYHNLKTQP